MICVCWSGAELHSHRNLWWWCCLVPRGCEQKGLGYQSEEVFRVTPWEKLHERDSLESNSLTILLSYFGFLLSCKQEALFEKEKILASAIFNQLWLDFKSRKMSFSLSEIFSSVVVQLCFKEHSLIWIDMRQLLHLGLSRWEKQKLRLNQSLSPNNFSANTRFMLRATDYRHPHFIITCKFFIQPGSLSLRASAILRTIYGKRKRWTVLLRGNPIRLIPTLFDHPVIPPNLILKTTNRKEQWPTVLLLSFTPVSVQSFRRSLFCRNLGGKTSEERRSEVMTAYFTKQQMSWASAIYQKEEHGAFLLSSSH